MRFYTYLLTVYSAAATFLLVLLVLQNRDLKNGRPPDASTPSTEIYSVEIGEAPTLGDTCAPVTLVQFTDFQCSFCARGADLIDDLFAELPGKIRLVFKHMPMPAHEQAIPAAAASMAAYQEGKFWEMQSLLFRNQERLGDELYREAAAAVGLELERFEADRHLSRWREYLRQDVEQAASLGVRATPTFFVNGRRLVGADPRRLRRAIQEAIDETDSASDGACTAGQPAAVQSAPVVLTPGT